MTFFGTCGKSNGSVNQGAVEFVAGANAPAPTLTSDRSFATRQGTPAR